jgi:riboflavin biosynthesis pyrimidine reductase
MVAGGAPVSAREFIASLDLRSADGPAPRVVGAMIASIDGHATLDGRAGGLGNPADRAVLRGLRAAADVVLVGRNTLTTERYATLLDPEQRDQRAAAGLPVHPLVATVSRHPELLADVPLLAEPDVEVVVYDAPDAALADLHDRRGARLIVCEGGPRLLHALAAAGALHDLVLTLAPLLVAGEGPSILTGGVLDTPTPMRLAHCARAGDHLMLHYRR